MDEEMKQFRDDIGRNPDDGETIMNGDDVGQFRTAIKQSRTGPVIMTEDGEPIGGPEIGP